MNRSALPLLPTSVVGSYATPSWLWTSMAAIERGEYGATDVRETFDDAVLMALSDQERAGIDIISDGELRRFYFVQSFYGKMTGIAEDPPLRKVGVYGYDSPPRYHTTGKVGVPDGLGIVEEYLFARDRTTMPLKVTCPGPLTLTIHIRPREGYRDRLELAQEFAGVINRELRRLVELGADFIQLDEPSFAIIPGTMRDWVELYNACVEGVDAKLALHVCFGNLGSRPRGKRRYAWMFPDLLDCRADQFVFEFANREMVESGLWSELGIDRELGAGVVDIKSFYVESPEDVAERIRELLEHVSPEKLYLNPDCGFFQLPRWISYLKLEALAKGAKIVRDELGAT